MSTELTTLPRPVTTPKEVAHDLLGTIKQIEEAIDGTKQQIEQVEGRGFFANVFSSSRNDLIAVSRSQGQINDLMLGMIQEVLTLNVMSYTYLASVMDEFHQLSRKGWTDTDGKMQRLSRTGRDFADTAGKIFTQIIDGSRSTHEAIELNTSDIAELKSGLKDKDEIDRQQSEELRALAERLKTKAGLIKELEAALAHKENLDDEQTRKITQALQTLSMIEKENLERSRRVEMLQNELQTVREELTAASCRLQLSDGAAVRLRKQHLVWVAVQGAAIVALATWIFWGT